MGVVISHNRLLYYFTFYHMNILREGESALKIKRRHPIALFLKITPYLISFLLVFLIAITIPFLSISRDLNEFLPEDFFLTILFGISLLLILLWQVTFVFLTIHYLDYWIITNQRTIHVELNSIFNRFHIQYFPCKDTRHNCRYKRNFIRPFSSMEIYKSKRRVNSEIYF